MTATWAPSAVATAGSTDPTAPMAMMFGPRDAEELASVAGVVATSHAWASGQAS